MDYSGYVCEGSQRDYVAWPFLEQYEQKCLFTLYRTLTTDQRNELTQVQFGWWPHEFPGWGPTYRSMADSKAAALVKSPPSMGGHSWKLHPQSSLNTLQKALLESALPEHFLTAYFNGGEGPHESCDFLSFLTLVSLPCKFHWLPESYERPPLPPGRNVSIWRQ